MKLWTELIEALKEQKEKGWNEEERQVGRKEGRRGRWNREREEKEEGGEKKKERKERKCFEETKC